MAKGKGKKTPRIGKAPQDSKQPRAGAHPESTEHESPVWHVGRADFEGPFGWGTVNDAEVWRYIHSKLRDFETMSWADIGNTRSHTIPVESLCAAAQRRLIDLGHDDISEVYSLRFRGANECSEFAMVACSRSYGGIQPIKSVRLRSGILEPAPVAGFLWMACATQEEIAEAVGVPRQTVTDWLSDFAETSATEESAKWHGFEPPYYNVWKLQNKTA